MVFLDRLAEAGDIGLEGMALRLVQLGSIPLLTSRVFIGDPIGFFTKGVECKESEISAQAVLLIGGKAVRLAAVIVELAPGKPASWVLENDLEPLELVGVCDEDTRYRIAERIEDSSFEGGFFDAVVEPALGTAGGLKLLGKGQIEEGRPILLGLCEGEPARLWRGLGSNGELLCLLLETGVVPEELDS
jgi:hypothetical protein